MPYKANMGFTGPAKTITVEPLEVPVIAPVEQPAPKKEPVKV